MELWERDYWIFQGAFKFPSEILVIHSATSLHTAFVFYVLWVQMCPLNSYVEGQSPSTSECDLIWVFLPTKKCQKFPAKYQNLGEGQGTDSSSQLSEGTHTCRHLDLDF